VSVEGAGPEARPYLLHNEPIRREGRIVGHVTSGAWGFRTGLSLGIASVAHPEGVTDDWIAAGGFTVEVAGVEHPLEVRTSAFYDPAGTRMRG
jgi:glycine cleavage system aminomethyltransferase T